jgi:hypothetical protein
VAASGGVSMRRLLVGMTRRSCKANFARRASDILLTQGVYRIGRGWVCRPSPEAGAAPEMFPQPDAAPSLTQSCCAGEEAPTDVADRAAIGPYHG